MIQTAMVSAGIDFDVSALSVLPEAVTNDKIVVITDVIPPLADGIIIDTMEPTDPVEGLIYINNGTGPLAITRQGSNVTLIVRPGDVVQWVDDAWILRDAYLGIDGAWDQFSRELYFSYTGNMSPVEEVEYSDGIYYQVKLLTSGEFTPLAIALADVFLVGGGGGSSFGGGGGGGYTITQKDVSLVRGVGITVSIGAEGIGGSNDDATAGGSTIFGVYNAPGGNPGRGTGSSVDSRTGGNGGSGGGATGVSGTYIGGKGGADGANGQTPGTNAPGTGQGTTTRAFADLLGELFSGGGGAWSISTPDGGEPGDGGGGRGKTQTIAAENGATNKGGGAGGGTPRNGGSGVAIIRWRKEAA